MQWREIEDFPGYSVSNLGRVRNDDTGRVLALQRNQHGVINVGLVRDGQQHKRSVAVLVAEAWLPETIEAFDTPIHLDGDLSNNHIDNLMWRPRWFAVKYHQQFKAPEPSIREQIQDVESGYRYNNSMHAATTYGLLDAEIKQAIIERTYVWPTYQRFRIVHREDR